MRYKLRIQKKNTVFLIVKYKVVLGGIYFFMHDGVLTTFCTPLLMSLLRCGQLNVLLTAQNRRRERRHCAGRVRSHARVAALETSSSWTIAKAYPKKVARFVSLYVLWRTQVAKRVWKLLYIVLKSRLCVCETRELMAAGGGYCGWVFPCHN